LFARLGPDADMPRTAESAQALLSEIEHTLATVNVDARLLATFMDELGDRLADGPRPPASGAAMVRVPPGRLATAKGEADDAPTHRQLADRLRVGDWWDFSVDDSRVPMQLIWISQPPANCTFANRSALSKTDFTLTDLSRQMQRGLAKPGKDLDMPLIERSEQSLFDDTYQSVIRQAMHDPVTGLLNRKGFLQVLDRMAMPDEAERAHAVGIIEFDQFRMIVNTCGDDAAENLTHSLAREVGAHIGPDAVLASFRDDTFALMLPNCSRIEGCSAIDRLLERVKDYSFQHGPHSYSIGFNVGVTEFAPDRFSAAEAIRRADSACITAKSQGRNRMQIYDQASPQLRSQESLMDWAGRIDSFLKGSGLHLRCQQVMPIGGGNTRLPYYEVLLGIEGEGGVEILPGHFIPAVERLQRAHEVDIWVIRNVFEWIVDNQSDFASVGGFAINLSATSLSSPEVMRYLQKALPDSDFPTDKIIFEITETAAIEGYGAAQDFIREIRRYGCKFALDDFGSGFTSYAHLKNLRTDTLKIDGSFVKDMLQNPGDFAMVKSMNDIGHSLGLLTVAEYVESESILEALREIGVDYVQGYAIHRPCRIDELIFDQVV
jgi:diguanylate cyclase (GGDEF)-like protein